MKTCLNLLVVMVLLPTAQGAASAADLARGKSLHEKHCVACHTSLTNGEPDTLYTRPDRRVTSLSGLKKQVRRCELSLGLRWFDEDIDDVAGFLNQDFYRFSK